MEILRAETDRYVLGVRLQKEDMESLYKKNIGGSWSSPGRQYLLLC
jgi:hypothetical protein